MKRIGFILVMVLAASGLLAACGGDSDSDGEPASYTIGVLLYSASLMPVVDGFQQGLAGHMPDASITYEIEQTVNTPGALLDGANRLVKQEVDLIFTVTTPAAFAAQQATQETPIPIVFAYSYDPVGEGLAQSMSDPGGNLTGVQIGGFIEKELYWLVTVGTEMQTIFAPFNPADASAVLSRDKLLEAAEKLNVNVITPEVFSPDDARITLEALPDQADGILILADGMVGSQAATAAHLGIERGIPTAGFDQQHIEEGVLLSFGVERHTVGQQAARLAHEIFKGTSPSDLPIEIAEFYLSVNLKTAQASGIALSDDTLLQANGVIIRNE